MSWVQNAFTQMGYVVLFIPETATELISGGVSPQTCGSNADFQKCLLRLQMEKEKTFEQAAQTMSADTSRRQIRKDRYCLTYENQYFEIDVYPFWTDKAIAEIELSDENAEIRFPDEIRVIKEVTDDAYKNASLAKI